MRVGGAGAVLGPLVVPKLDVAVRVLGTRKPVLFHVGLDRRDLSLVELLAATVLAPLGPQSMEGPGARTLALLQGKDEVVRVAF